MKYLADHDLLDSLQCGFRTEHRTQTALNKLVNDIRFNMDKRIDTILILFDFFKAFDLLIECICIQKSFAGPDAHINVVNKEWKQ